MTVDAAFPLGRTLRVLEHRAQAHDFATWERRFVEAILSHLRPGMVVFDVGAEEGEFSALWAQVVGPENVHLFEPTPSVWPNVRRVWEANHQMLPGGCFPGFVSTRGHTRSPGRAARLGWPEEAIGEVQPDSRFSVVVERPDIPSISLDEYPAAPDVIVCDVEGAEGLVFDGARRVLAEARPVCFVSIHPPEFMVRFGQTQERVFRAFAEAGYVARFISEDHESHWGFWPVEKLGPSGCHGSRCCR